MPPGLPQKIFCLAMLIAMAVAVADQALKQAVMRLLALGDAVSVIPGFFNITHVRNSGAVWGFFSGQGVALILLSFVCLGVLTAIHRKMRPAPSMRVAVGLIAGGVLGNLCDRLAFGFVVDFLDFHAAGWHWPAFNLADAAICAGMGLYMIASWPVDRADHKNASEPAASGAHVP